MPDLSPAGGPLVSFAVELHNRFIKQKQTPRSHSFIERLRRLALRACDFGLVEENVMLIDHYASWLAVLAQSEAVFRMYVPDGIHPDSEVAQEIIAPYILKLLSLKTEDNTNRP